MKMMKLIMALAIAGVVSLQANSAEFFKTGPSGTGGIIGNQVVFVYDEKSEDTKLDGEVMKIVQINAKNKICKSEESRAIIEKYGMGITYIYLRKDGVGVVEINSCK